MKRIALILATLGGGLRTGIPGMVSLISGTLIAFTPMLGAVFVPYTLGGLALLGGGAAIVGAFKRRHDGDTQPSPGPAEAATAAAPASGEGADATNGGEQGSVD